MQTPVATLNNIVGAAGGGGAGGGSGVISSATGSGGASEMGAAVSSGGGGGAITHNKFAARIDAPDPNAVKIYTAQDLHDIGNNLSGSYVLMNDIDLSQFQNGEWTPIGFYDMSNDNGKYDTCFRGVFDGQGHVIRNLKISGLRKCSGLFAASFGAEIKNVGMENTMLNINLDTLNGAGALCGWIGNGIVSNCYSTGGVSIITPSAIDAGGFAGYGENSIISNCNNAGNINVSSEYGSRAGGICGRSSNVKIISCNNSGIISGDIDMYAAGGIVGESKFTTLRNCHNAGGVSAIGSLSYTGGILGHIWKGIIERCSNTGDISSRTTNAEEASSYAGGIAGWSNNATIIACFNEGDILSDNTAGGISARSDDDEINLCYNTGTVTAIFNGKFAYLYAGGIAGSSAGSLINNVYNTGKIISKNFPSNIGLAYAGGLSGMSIYGAFSYGYNTGNVSAAASDINGAYASGIAGGGDHADFIGCRWNIDSSQSVNGAFLANAGKRGIGRTIGSDYIIDTTLALTSLQMKSGEHFTGFGFDTAWMFDKTLNSGYPVLQAFFGGAGFVEVSGLTLNKESPIIAAGQKETLTAAVLPVNATYKTVEWHSDNIKIADVSNKGAITAISAGKAKITAVAEGGVKASCTVTVTRGKCGDNLFWDYYYDDALLKITGTGDMWDWRRYGDDPWFGIHDLGLYANTIDIAEGVTSIGGLAFYGIGRFTTDLILPDSLNSIGSYAFSGALNLSHVYIPKNVVRIGEWAFDCAHMQAATFEGNAPAMGDRAFPSDPYFKIYFHEGAAGFTTPAWHGYAAESIPASTPTHVKIVTVIGQKVFYVNGKAKTTDVAPILHNGRTMVPIRFIAEALGAEVGWDGDSSTVTVSLDGKTLTMAIDQPLSGMDAAPFLRDGRTMVPLRYVSENFSAYVLWDGNERKVTICR